MMAFDDIKIVELPRPRVGTPEEFAARYEGQLMTPTMVAQLRHDARASLGTGLVFISNGLGKVHVGPMDKEAFEEFVGHAPVDDDLHRVNCGDAGKVGHLFCGWCDTHECPKLACGCVPHGA